MKLFHAQNKTASSIGGTPLYIISGQSNCGRSTVSEMTSPQSAVYGPAVSNAFMIDGWRYYQFGVTEFEAFDPGFNTMLENRNADDEFGPETSLAHNLQNYISGNRYYVKFATGNTSLAVDYAAPSGARYLQLLEGVEAAINDAASLGVTDLRLHAFIWMQGENDAVDSGYAAAYQTNLENFFNEFTDWWVNEMGMNSNFKKVIGRIQDIDAGFEEAVRMAQANYCANGANNAIMINTDAYTRKDYIHYDATSQIQFGVDIFNQVKNL